MQYRWLLFVFVLAACQQEKFTPESLSSYIADSENGLRKENEINNVQVQLTYRPTDLWVYQETGSLEVENAELTKLRQRYDQYYYFILGLSANNKEALHQAGSFGQYSELVQTLSFRMADYVTLTTSASDTIPTADFMLNRTYGMSDATEVLFVFNKEKIKDQEWVQFNLNEFGMGLGNQRFRFDRKKLDEPPTLNFTIAANNQQLPTNN